MNPAESARQAVDTILAGLGDGGQRGAVVDAPPGAGKSALIIRAARQLTGAGLRVMVVAQTNDQVDDLAVRFAADDPTIPAGRLCGQDYQPPARVTVRSSVAVSPELNSLTGCPVVFATAAKWATVTATEPWPWAVVDEAYQMRSDLLLRIAGHFERALFVGDPGQLDPFATVDTTRWSGLTWDPMQSAVAVMLRHNPGIPVRTLPVSWRLPPSAAPVIAEAFYPFTGFQAGTSPGQRLVRLSTAPFGHNPLDQTVELAAETGWALYELPARYTPRTDADAATACAMLAARILQRGAVAVSEHAPGGRPITADRIAIGTAHRDQAQAVRAALGDGFSGLTVDTANRLQGREFDITVVWHPLSGRRDATAFHLEAGRLCVLTSRHRHACVVVARAGIPELLDAHPSTEPVHLNVPAKFPDGWEAHQAVMAHLSRHQVAAP